MSDQEILLVYGTNWCPDCTRAKNVLQRLNIEYKWVDTDADQTAKDYIRNVNGGFCSVPTIIFPDGSHLTEPSDAELAHKVHSFFNR